MALFCLVAAVKQRYLGRCTKSPFTITHTHILNMYELFRRGLDLGGLVKVTRLSSYRKWKQVGRWQFAFCVRKVDSVVALFDVCLFCIGKKKKKEFIL